MQLYIIFCESIKLRKRWNDKAPQSGEALRARINVRWPQLHIIYINYFIDFDHYVNTRRRTYSQWKRNRELSGFEPLPDGDLDQEIARQVQTPVCFILEGLSNIIFQYLQRRWPNRGTSGFSEAILLGQNVADSQGGRRWCLELVEGIPSLFVSLRHLLIIYTAYFVLWYQSYGPDWYDCGDKPQTEEIRTRVAGTRMTASQYV